GRRHPRRRRRARVVGTGLGGALRRAVRRPVRADRRRTAGTGALPGRGGPGPAAEPVGGGRTMNERMTERGVEHLNAALHELCAADDGLYLLGEDVLDPYGGAFKATRGLSTAYPDRVLATPLSENAIVGVAGGLALAGNRVLVEIMFGDFIGL